MLSMGLVWFMVTWPEMRESRTGGREWLGKEVSVSSGSDAPRRGGGGADERRGDADAHAGVVGDVVDFPNQVVDDFAHEGGEVDVKGGGGVIEIMVDHRVEVPEDGVEVALGLAAGLAHGAEESTAEVIHG